MTSQLHQNFQGSQAVEHFVVSILVLSFTAEGCCAQPYSINFRLLASNTKDPDIDLLWLL